MYHPFRAVVVASLAVLCLGDAPVFAQGGSLRPFQGVFGGRASGTPDQSLDLSLTLVGAYDDNILAETTGISPSAPAVGGFFTMFSAESAYEWRGQRSQFGATGGTVLRYYGDSPSVYASAAAGVGFSTELARRTTFSANQTFAYSPSYLTGLFPLVAPSSPGDLPPLGANYAVDDTSSYQYASRLTVNRGVTRRGTLTGLVDYVFTDYVEEAVGRKDQSVTRARVEFSRGMTRYASLRVAYRFANGDMGVGVIGGLPGQKTTEHGFVVGVDYSRSLSATRRFTLAFGVGSSSADLPLSEFVGLSGGLQHRAIGDASLGYQFNRTWETRASYRRGLEYVPELAEPVFTDGVAVSLTGLFTPRTDFAAGAGYSTGVSAVYRSAAAFDTYTANARVRQAVTRALAIYLEYVYYFYDFDRAQVQPGVPPQMERNGVRAGLTLWLPVYRR